MKLEPNKSYDLPLEAIQVKNDAREDLGDLSALTASIKDKGVLQNLVIDDTGRLLAGRRRYAAARAAGLKTVPVRVRAQNDLDALEVELLENIERKDLTWVERAKLEGRIMEKRKAIDPTWSRQKQADLLDQSKGATVRRLQLAEAMKAIPDLAKAENEDQAWKQYKKIEEKMITEALAARSPKAGDATKWGKSHYVTGSAFDGLKKLAPGTFNFAEVDPPYAIELDKRKEKAKDDRMDVYNEVEGSQYESFIKEIAGLTFKSLADNSFAVWWFGPDWYSTVLAALENVGFKVNPVPGMWYKGQQGQTSSPDTSLASSYESFFVCRKGQPKLRKPGRSNVFQFSPVAPQRKIHPTERPIDLMLELLDTFCLPGTRMVVPFLGSGVSLRAAYQRSLTAIGWDLDERLKERFLTRLKQDSLGDAGSEPEEKNA